MPDRRTARDAYKQAQREAAFARLTLDRPALDRLLDHLDAALTARGCDHTLRRTREWADAEGRTWEPLEAGLQDGAAFCDCEVLANADPEG